MSRLAPEFRTLFTAGAVGLLDDAHLLERFRSGDGPAAEAAFAALVDRHGGMVLGVCHAILNDAHDAEDAFQATFLVLARRAGALGDGVPLAGWLHGVARRVALKARVRATRRRRRERMAAEQLADRPEPSHWPELHDEIARLPEWLRTPIVLRHLEGLSYEQVAAQLNCPVGTVQSRLARGRERLRDRLTRRGVAPAVAALAVLDTRIAPAAVPPSWTATTALAAFLFHRHRPTAGVISTEAARLARSAQGARTMLRLTALFVSSLLALGLLSRSDEPPRPSAKPTTLPQAKSEPEPAAKPAPQSVHVKVVDSGGRPLPGIRVRALHLVPGEREVTSDIDGRLRVDVADGEYLHNLILMATPDGDTLGWTRPRGLGQPAPDEAEGTAENPLTLKLLPLDRIVNGTVRDEADKPVGGVRIRVRSLTDPVRNVYFPSQPTEPVRDGWPIETVTDEHGQYVLRLPEGAGATLTALHANYTAPSFACTPMQRSLRPVTLQPAGSIVGRVTDKDGRPVGRARVAAQLIERPRGWSAFERFETLTDARGRFRLADLPPSVHNVMLMPDPADPRWTAEAVEGVRVRAREETEIDLTRILGRAVRGVVLDGRSRRPQPRVAVTCIDASMPSSGYSGSSAESDADGRFTFFVPPGPAQIAIIDPMYRGGPMDRREILVPEEADPEPIVLLTRAKPSPFIKPAAKANAPGAGKAVAAARPQPEPPPPAPPVFRDPPVVRPVSGRVNAPDGQPIPAARVQGRVDFSIVAATDRDGRFELPSLPRVEVTLNVGADGYESRRVTVGPDLDTVEVTLNRITPAVVEVAPAPPDLPKGIAFVDLGPLGNDPLDRGPGEPGATLSNLPRGVRQLGNDWFRIGDLSVHADGRPAYPLPESVEGIKVGARSRELVALIGTNQAAEPGTEIGRLVLHYDDGTTAELPIRYGEEVVNWYPLNVDPESPSRVALAWTRSEPAAFRPDVLVSKRLCAARWDNPHAGREVETIDLVAVGPEADVFLVALTLKAD